MLGWLTVAASLQWSEIKDIIAYTTTRPHLGRPSAMLVHVAPCNFTSLSEVEFDVLEQGTAMDHSAAKPFVGEALGFGMYGFGLT